MPTVPTMSERSSSCSVFSSMGRGQVFFQAVKNIENLALLFGKPVDTHFVFLFPYVLRAGGRRNVSEGVSSSCVAAISPHSRSIARSRASHEGT